MIDVPDVSGGGKGVTVVGLEQSQAMILERTEVASWICKRSLDK
jgi:hypothetical protein